MDAEKKLHLIGMTGGHENGQRKMTPRKASHDSGTLKPLQDLGTGRLCWIVEGSGTYQFHIRRCFYTQRELPIVKTEYKNKQFSPKMTKVDCVFNGPRTEISRSPSRSQQTEITCEVSHDTHGVNELGRQIGYTLSVLFTPASLFNITFV